MWLRVGFIETDGFERIEGAGWLILFGGMLVCFAIAYAFVRVVAWVVRGFTEGGGRKKGGEG